MKVWTEAEYESLMRSMFDDAKRELERIEEEEKKKRRRNDNNNFLDC